MSRPVRSLRPTDVSLKARVRRSAEWKTRRATASWRVLPDFVIIGGQRCGTTSLHEALAAHSGIQAGFRKEVHYFDLHHERDIDWYRAHFPLMRSLGARIAFEATPNYLASADTPRLMRSVIPDARFIVLLRDPIERTHSSWKLRTYEGSDDRPFAAAVDDELAGVSRGYEDLDEERSRWLDRAKRWAYVEKSRYDEHLERWFACFDRDRFLIFQSEALFSDPEQGLADIQNFLGVERDRSIGLPKANFTAPSPTIEPSFRQYLSDYFAPHNERLATLTGAQFDWG